mmetsp:Transcript_18586/g.33501  ORF Transcript_18586/g.33501 Transcript_18586/m.33501 type:complete len:242 (-) Transcript_18586:998-1723(-)
MILPLQNRTRFLPHHLGARVSREILPAFVDLHDRVWTVCQCHDHWVIVLPALTDARLDRVGYHHVVEIVEPHRHFHLQHERHDVEHDFEGNDFMRRVELAEEHSALGQFGRVGVRRSQLLGVERRHAPSRHQLIAAPRASAAASASSRRRLFRDQRVLELHPPVRIPRSIHHRVDEDVIRRGVPDHAVHAANGPLAVRHLHLAAGEALVGRHGQPAGERALVQYARPRFPVLALFGGVARP